MPAKVTFPTAAEAKAPSETATLRIARDLRLPGFQRRPNS
jgi:hypothetical protein